MDYYEIIVRMLIRNFIVVLFLSDSYLFVYECKTFLMLLQDMTRPHLSAFSASHTGKNTNEVMLTFGHSLSTSLKIFDIRKQYCAIKVNVTRIVLDIL